MAQYKVIAGTFHVKGFQPDGDSIRFQANNQANGRISGPGDPVEVITLLLHRNRSKKHRSSAQRSRD